MKIVDERGRLFGKINVFDFLVILFFISLISIYYFIPRSVMNKPVKKAEEIEINITCNLVKVSLKDLELIKVGDKEFDESGVTIGEIVWIGKAKPYRYKIDIGSEEIIIKDAIGLNEVPVRLKITLDIRDDGNYYKSRTIAINSPFEFKTAKYTVTAVPFIEAIERAEKIDLNIVLKNLTEDKLKLISVGDKEIDEKGNVVAEILKIGKIENNTYAINLGGGNIIIGESSNEKQLFVRMRIKCRISNVGKIYFKGQEIKYDSLLEFKTDKYSVKGILVSLLINERWVEAKVKFSDVIPELSKVISEGDTEKDPLNKLVGRLKSIISNRPSEVQVLALQQNKFVSIAQPFQRDIITLVDLLCIEKEGVLYFKNYPVKIGNMVTFTTGLYSISGIIIGLDGH